MKSTYRGFREVMAFDNYWQLLLHRVLFRATNLHVYRKGKVEAIVDHRSGDVMGLRACMAGHMYHDLLPLMKLPRRPNVLDIGAHVGGFPLMLAAAGVNPRRLVCVEFNGPTFHRLYFNIHHNFDAREVVLLRGAIGGVSGTLRVSNKPGGTGTSARPAHGIDTEEIRVLTFDEAVSEGDFEGEIDVCKIDVEGAEHDVFASGCDKALDRCNNLVIEVHDRDGRGFSEVKSYLMGRKFDLLVSNSGSENVGLFRRR